MAEPIIINNFDQAIADSPHKGFALMRNVDIEAFPGAVKSQKAPLSLFVTAFSGTFTAVAATDVCTASGFTVPSTGTAVVLTTTGTLPAGLSTATTYFIIYVSDSTFKLATTITNADAGTAIDITDAGTGVHTSTSRNPGTINYIIKNPSGGVRFFHDSNGRVWYLSSGGTRCRLLNGNTLTNPSGKGLALLRASDGSATYLFAFRNASIDVVNVRTAAMLTNPTWTNAWQALNTAAGSSNSHKTIVAQDNIIYFCDDRYVGSIKENSGQVFDPANAATFTYNSQALDLPILEVSEWIEELGTDLLIAGNRFNKIYPWDRISDSFNLPLPVPETGVYRLKNIGNLVFILAGNKGNIYTTQGSYVQHYKRIPDYLLNASSAVQDGQITWGGIGAINSALIFGVGGLTTANNGVYMLYPDGRLIITNMPSTGATNVTALESTSDFYYMGYASGADYFDTNRYSSFQSVVQSAFYKVATKTEKGTYSSLEAVIAKPAASGSLRISYRQDTSSSFTTLDTFTADSSSTTFESDGIGLIDIENIQAQAEFDGTIELLEIRIIP